MSFMYRSIPKPPMPPPPGQTPGHLAFLKNFRQIPRYVASLDGQMPHPLELQRGSNTPPSRHVKQTVETSSAKFSATTNFLFSLSSLHTLKAYSTIELYKTTTTEKPTWNRREQWPVNAAHLLNQRIAKFFCFRPLTDVLTRKSNASPGGPHFGSNSLLYGT